MPASGTGCVASAESLVKVRPIGAVEGDTVPAKVARMEVAVKAGELDQGARRIRYAARSVEGGRPGFRRQDQARVEAEELVAKALAGAMKQA